MLHLRPHELIRLLGGGAAEWSLAGQHRYTTTRIGLAGLLLFIVTVPAIAGSGALGCFTRIYDRAHLARHPDQLVTAVKLHIHKPPRDSMSKYWFLAQFKLRGRDETLRTSGICNEKASGLHCFVECDGGGVDVVPRAREAMMYLDRIRVAACDGDEAGEELTGGKDDLVFRPNRVENAVCAGMKP